MRLTNLNNPGGAPVAPNARAVLVLEPAKLEEFLKLIDITFHAAWATYLQDFKEFKSQLRESLLQVADRYDEVAMPLLEARLMTSRNVALNLRGHLPFYLRKKTFAAMERHVAKRKLANEALTNKDELIALAQKEKLKLLSFEAEMRVAGVEPKPRAEERVGPIITHPLAVDHKKRAPKQQRPNLHERLAPRSANDNQKKNRVCHKCEQPGHIAINCPSKERTAPLTPKDKGDFMAAHKTAGHVCETY